MANAIIDNWYWIVIGLCVVTCVGAGFVRFMKYPSETKLAKIKEFLLVAVVEAEKLYKSGTGKIKLAYVFNLFCEKYPFISKFITVEQVDAWLQECLEVMRNLIGIGNLEV